MADTPPPYVHEELDARSLHFSTSAIQSRMQLRRPDALELEYTRLMMGWPMFRPQARRLAMIGLGGGSIAKFCHRHLPRATMLVVEIDPRVIALREAFLVPADDARFRVVEGDGAQLIATTEERFDVLMVDAFDADGMPAALGTQRFYDDCLDALATDGLFVVNLHAGHPQHAVYVDRIARSFGQRVLRVTDRDGSNTVVFAAKGDAIARAGGASLRKPAALAEAPWSELRGAFSRIASALQRDQANVIAPSSSRP
ncbi:MAG TPA: fused MFS/spermidine synthase [Burkholderiaceae bacterium]|nr:fused MFS/spermidine synthase [Burkholderiaceae bacterium]